MPDFSVEAPASATEHKDSPTAGPVAIAADVTTGGYVRAPEEWLLDHLQRAETVAFLLQHNFSGDGSFDSPGDAPGMRGMCAFVTAELRAAEKLSRDLGLQQHRINHASAIAQHMAALADDDLGGDKLGFRVGDCVVSMAYWTIEELVKAAFEELSA